MRERIFDFGSCVDLLPDVLQAVSVNPTKMMNDNLKEVFNFMELFS